jgi:hypothetical protein
MHGPHKRQWSQWRDLCEEAQVEDDPRKFHKLAGRIKGILDDQQNHLDKPRNHRPLVKIGRSETKSVA